MQISLTEDARRRTKPITIGHLSDSGERKTIHFSNNWSSKSIVFDADRTSSSRSFKSPTKETAVCQCGSFCSQFVFQTCFDMG